MLSKRHLSILGLLIFLLFWVHYFYDVYLSADTLLPRDNYKYHYPFFLYVVETLKLWNQFPTWVYNLDGGMWIEPLTNNFLTWLPHRIVGYAIASTTELPPVFVYKASLLFLGTGLFLSGIFLLARKLLGIRYAFYAIVLGLLTSMTISFLHQEQALGTILFAPWLWWAGIKTSEDRRYFLLFATLFGLALNSHYPQLYFAYGLLIFLSFLVQRKLSPRKIAVKLGFRLSSLGVLAFSLSASPLIYSYATYQGKIDSPFRNQFGKLDADSYESYVLMNSYGKCSLDPSNLRKYFGFSHFPTKPMGILDDQILFMTNAIALVLFLLILLPIPSRSFHLTMISGLALFAIGIHGLAPKLLWNLIPGIKMFRQWYFFLPFLNLHLLFAGLYAIKELQSNRLLSKRSPFTAGLVLFAALWSFGWLSANQALLGLCSCFVMLAPWSKLRVGFTHYAIPIWVGLHALSWSHQALQNYRQQLLSAKPYRPVKNIGTLAKIYKNSIAVPRASDIRPVKQLAKESLFYWKSANGTLFSAKNDLKVEIGNQGLDVFLKRNSTLRELLFLQFNDGHWQIGDSQKLLEVATGPLHTLRIPKEFVRKGSFRIVRSPSLWHWLSLLMWVPLVLVLCNMIFSKKRWNIPSFDFFDVSKRSGQWHIPRGLWTWLTIRKQE